MRVKLQQLTAGSYALPRRRAAYQHQDNRINVASERLLVGALAIGEFLSTVSHSAQNLENAFYINGQPAGDENIPQYDILLPDLVPRAAVEVVIDEIEEDFLPEFVPEEAAEEPMPDAMPQAIVAAMVDIPPGAVLAEPMNAGQAAMDRDLCVVCLNEQHIVDHVAVPCGHLLYCRHCATRLGAPPFPQMAQGPVCVVCNGPCNFLQIHR